MPNRICKECGKEFFTTSSRKQFCDDVHVRYCKQCGKEFVVPNNKLAPSVSKYYCSAECSNKAKVPHDVQLHVKACIMCGKLFTTTSRSTICKACLVRKCKVCGKTFIATPEQVRANIQTCSKECRYKQSLATYKMNYSADTNPTNHAKLIDKYSQSIRERYGVDNPMQSAEIQAKSLATKRAKYGDRLEGITSKMQDTLQSRYGAKFMMNVPEFREKAKQTCISKYGVDNYAKSFNFLLEVISDPSKADKCLAFRNDPRGFILSVFQETKPSLAEIAEECGICESSVGYIIDKSECTDLVRFVFSKMEDEVFNYVTSILPTGTQVIRNTRKVITPYELDIYLPDYNLGIECNPTITHNSSFGGWSVEDAPKPINYHQMKTDMCNDRNIFLFHIFGYEWTHRQDVIKSMLRNLLRGNTQKIYARKTQLRQINDADCMKFLNDNHRQRGVHSKIRLGLYYNNELVSVMTFSKMRKTIGTGHDDLSDCYELVRFCNKLNTSVIGGASKLFKYFVTHWNPTQIRSFSDRAHTKGTLYSTLGFVASHSSTPGYVWVSMKTDVAYSRNNAQKHNIRRFLNDDSIDLNSTEVEIMKSHGYAQVFDSGTILWIWKGENIYEN